MVHELLRARPLLSALSLVALALVATEGCGSSSSNSAATGQGASGGSAPIVVGQGGSSVTGGSGGTGGSTMPQSGTFCALPTPAPAGITAPPGFCVHAYSGDTVQNVLIKEARTIRFAPNGDVFIVTPGKGTPGANSGGTGTGAIVVLPDDDHDGSADSVVTYAGGNTVTAACAAADESPDDLTCAHGLAFIDGFLYFTRANDLRRIPYTPGDCAASGESQFVAALGEDSGSNWRFTHTIEKGTDGTIWVTRGQFDTACAPDALHAGAVLSVDVTTLPATPTVVADGFRNPMYIRCNAAKQCFVDELSGDGWDAGGREKLALIQRGTAWGYPCCYTTGAVAPGGSPDICAGVSTENLGYELHSTPFGLDFETGKWPAPYANRIFIALHGAVGSWTGTRVISVGTDANGLPMSDASDFATGWSLDASGGVAGRATDLAFSPDGRLFVIDDNSGGVWWIAPYDLPVPAGW